MVNKNLPLVLSDLFEYDISSCYYRILKNIGWDLSEVVEDDKITRNIQLGLMQRDNVKLSRFLQDSTKSIIDFYLKENNISPNEVAVRQKDGVILTKNLERINLTLPIDFRGVVSKLIISRTYNEWLILYMDGRVDVKGVSNKPVDISFYNLFRNLDFTNKKNLVKGIEIIRRKILSSENVEWFACKSEDEYSIPVKGEGEIKLRKSSLHSIDQNDIDKDLLWDKYVWPFVQSLVSVYIIG